MVRELPLQILPWEDAYPLHVHILGMVGLPQKTTHTHTTYCRNDKLTSFGKLDPTKNFGSSSSRSWNSRLFFGGLFDVVFMSWLLISPLTERLKLQWVHCRWSALGMMSVWMPRAKTNGFWATNVELKRRDGFLKWGLTVSKKNHAMPHVEWKKSLHFEVVEKFYCQTWRMKHFLGLDESSDQSVMVQFSFVWNTSMVSLGHHFYQTHRILVNPQIYVSVVQWPFGFRKENGWKGPFEGKVSHLPPPKKNGTAVATTSDLRGE